MKILMWAVIALMFLTVTSADAALPTGEEVKQALAQCESIRSNDASLRELEQQKCRYELKVRVYGAYVDAGKGYQVDLDEARNGLGLVQGKIDQRVKELSAQPRVVEAPPVPIDAPTTSAPVVAPPPPPVPSPAGDLRMPPPQPEAPAAAQPESDTEPPAAPAPDAPAPSEPPASAPPAAPVVPPNAGFVPPPMTISPAPGQYFASTRDDRSWTSRVHFAGIASGARHAFRSDGWTRVDARLILMKNGAPIVVRTPDGEVTKILADLNGDGQPEPIAFWAVDPTYIDNIYLQYIPGDDVQFVWLTYSGLGVWQGENQIPIWKPYRRTHHPLSDVAKRYKLITSQAYTIN